jgi:putative nucleotidyltransferase with HDIG domain
MTIPGRVAAAALLLSLDPPPWFIAHSRAVAEVAAFLAARIQANGIAVNRPVVEAAALLHDIDKILPQDDPVRRLGHGHGSAAWLTARGHPELARAVAGHPVTRLAEGEEHRRWAAFASREERVVAYADKRARERVVSMDARFERWRRRHRGWDEGTWRAVRDRADRLQAEVCRAAGIEPTEVRRLAWTADAFRAAAATAVPLSIAR